MLPPVSLPPRQAAAEVAHSVGNASAPVQSLRATAADVERRLADAIARREALRAQLIGAPTDASATQRAQLKLVEQQVASLDKSVVQLQASLQEIRTQIMVSEKVGSQPAIAGTSVPPRASDVDRNSMTIAGVFTVFVLAPLAIAFAIRLIRRGNAPVNQRELTDMADRVRRIENAVETMAVEVERVSEGQRFLARTLGEPAKSLAAPGAAEVRRP